MEARAAIVEGYYTRQRMLNLTKVSPVLKDGNKGRQEDGSDGFET